jgi:SynChlorMet cassette protein ScmC
MMEPRPARSYLLRLNEHLAWCLIGTDLTCAWLEKLARILGLERGYSSTLPGLLFVPRADEADGRGDEPPLGDMAARTGLPEGGWKVDRLRPVRMWTHPEARDIVFELPDSREPVLDAVSMFHAVFPIYRNATHIGGMPLHAALVERHGRAALLCGASGTGKSTCCRRFPQEWNVLADDETLVLPGRSGSYLAHPFPTWSDYWLEGTGRTRKVERAVPLASLLFLEHSETPGLVPMGQGEAAARINRSALQIYERSGLHLERPLHARMRVRVFDNSCRLARSLPAFMLRTSLSSPFWEDVEKTFPELPEDR